MDKVKLALRDLRALSKVAVQNGTETAWIEAALQWMEQAAARVAQLEVKCDGCGGNGLDRDDHNYVCVACGGCGFVQHDATPPPPLQRDDRVKNLVLDLQHMWDEVMGYPDTQDERDAIEARIKDLVKAVSEPRKTFDISPDVVRAAAAKAFGSDVVLSAPYWVDEDIVRFGVTKGGTSFGANYHYREGRFR